jgi:uncharacterized membrane protein
LSTNLEISKRYLWFMSDLKFLKNMTNLTIFGRAFYGVGIIGIGILHFFYKGFRPIILPMPAESTESISALIYLLAIYFLVSGILILIGRYVTEVSLLLGVIFFLFLVGGHLPIRLENHPEISGIWIDAIKLLALSGGAFVIAMAFSRDTPSKYYDKLKKLGLIGRCFFAFMLVFFGIGHLINPEGVSTLVPKYISHKVFWTYVGGIALIASGISIFANFKVKYTGLLLGIMLFLWLILLHLYYAIRFPHFRDGENIIGSFECLAFCGIALVIAGGKFKIQK